MVLCHFLCANIVLQGLLGALFSASFIFIFYKILILFSSVFGKKICFYFLVL